MTSKLASTQLLLVAEGRRRGYTFDVLYGYHINLIQAHRDNTSFIFQHWPGYLRQKTRDDFPRFSSKVCQKSLLSACGLPVPRLVAVVRHPVEVDVAWLSGQRLVCKPVFGSLGYNVSTNVATSAELFTAVQAATERGHECLIEEHVDGLNYRIVVANYRYVSCVLRRSPHVVGDGKSTIATLVEAANSARAPEEDIAATAHRICIEECDLRTLACSGISLNTTPAAGEMITVARTILSARGATMIDVTDDVHPDTSAMCEAFASAYALPLVGFDFIAADASVSALSGGAFNEINTNDVQFAINELCNIGVGRPVARHIWDAAEAAMQGGHGPYV